jgi:hypothetical protein
LAWRRPNEFRCAGRCKSKIDVLIRSSCCWNQKVSFCLRDTHVKRQPKGSGRPYHHNLPRKKYTKKDGMFSLFLILISLGFGSQKVRYFRRSAISWACARKRVSFQKNNTKIIIESGEKCDCDSFHPFIGLRVLRRLEILCVPTAWTM